jgi:vacuolar-type H+-ATPase subunit C/Vma6
MGAFRYSAAAACTRAGLSRLLRQEMWGRLLESSGLGEFRELLSRTGYREAAAAESGNIEETEKRIHARLAAAVRLPMTFLQGKARKFFDWLWCRFEIDNLAVLLRAVHHRVRPERIRAALVPLGPQTNVDWQALSRSGSLSTAIERLATSYQGDIYSRVLRQAAGEYGRSGKVFVLEAALYRAYFHRLLYLLDNLSRQDARDAAALVEEMVNGENFIWACRYKVYFGLSPEEILGYTLQRRLRVDAEVIRRIATGASIPGLVEELWAGRLPGLDRLSGLSVRQVLVELELSFRRRQYTLAQGYVQRHPFRLAMILAYRALVESEARDLITLVEAKSSGWPVEKTRSFLIRSGAES